MSTTTNKKSNASTTASKDQIKFSGEVDNKVNEALAAYIAERIRLCPALAEKPLTERAINGSSSAFNVGTIISKRNGWSVRQKAITTNGVVRETYPELTNGVESIALKALCNMVITGFSVNPNDVFYTADHGPEDGQSFADIDGVQKASPTADVDDIKKCVAYMNKKPNYTPIRLYCEIIANPSLLDGINSLKFHGYIYRQGVERGTNRPYFNRISLWSIDGTFM